MPNSKVYTSLHIQGQGSWKVRKIKIKDKTGEITTLKSIVFASTVWVAADGFGWSPLILVRKDIK
jgi:hypothetical protein